MRRVAFVGLAVFLVVGVFMLTKQMKHTASDSKDATTAAVLREQLFAWYSDNKEYPPSLESVWSRGAMREYRMKYDVADERRMIFSYTSHSNWYELSFTNFGAIQIQIGSNGIVLR
jgi:hypothetical protein